MKAKKENNMEEDLALFNKLHKNDIIYVIVGKTRRKTTRAIVLNVWPHLRVAHVHVLDDAVGSSSDNINVYADEIVWE